MRYKERLSKGQDIGITVAIHQDGDGEQDGSGSPCLDWWDGLAPPLTSPPQRFLSPQSRRSPQDRADTVQGSRNTE